MANDQDMPRGEYNLRLYVAGQTPKSLAAMANLKRICEGHLAGRYTIEVIDLLLTPQLAAGDQIVALPTLIRRTANSTQKDHRHFVRCRAGAGPARLSAPRNDAAP